MENFSLKEIVVALLAAVGGVTGLLKLAAFVTGVLDKRKADREKKDLEKLTNAIEYKRLAAENEHIDDEAVKEAIWKLYRESEEKCSNLKDELKAVNESQRLSKPVIAKLYQDVRTLRKQVNIIEDLVQQNESEPNLLAEIEILRQQVDKLENELP